MSAHAAQQSVSFKTALARETRTAVLIDVRVEDARGELEARRLERVLDGEVELDLRSSSAWGFSLALPGSTHHKDAASIWAVSLRTELVSRGGADASSKTTYRTVQLSGPLVDVGPAETSQDGT